MLKLKYSRCCHWCKSRSSCGMIDAAVTSEGFPLYHDSELFPCSECQQRHFLQVQPPTVAPRIVLCLECMYALTLCDEFTPIEASLGSGAVVSSHHENFPISGISLLHSILSFWKPLTTTIGELMSTTSQGTSGPGGRAGFQHALERLVSRAHPTAEPVLTWLDRLPLNNRCPMIS